ncbi:MAG: GTP-binding protein [Candidatus Lokiarchaeota archaeon]|nr:GTP-binding protein [Candidatus Lokiarchaeota archaeon]
METGASAYKIKVLLCGAKGVGKTELIKPYVKSAFQMDYKLTVGVDILTKDVMLRSGQAATISIWDLGTQKRFEFIRSTFYRGASGAILVFDLTRAETYEDATRTWAADIRSHCGPVPFMLVGTGLDRIAEDGRAVDAGEARKWADSHDSIYAETGASLKGNLEPLFSDFAEQLCGILRVHVRHVWKLLVVGADGVGKRSIVSRFASKEWWHGEDPTEPLVTRKVTVRLDRETGAFLSIWFARKQSTLASPSIRSSFYTGTSGALLVFDLTRPETFDVVVGVMLDGLMEHCAGIPCVLVGNKRDLFKPAEHSQLRDRAQRWANRNGMAYFEACAGTGANVDDTFNEIADKIGLLEK